MGKLSGKRVVVTGGGQGLGLATVRGLIQEGCDLAIHYNTSRGGAEELVLAAQKNKLRAQAFQSDLTDERSVQAFVQSAADYLGGIDVLINNAGDLVGRRQLAEINLDFWDKVMSINLTSMMLVTRECVPHLAKNSGSSIVNLASLAGRKGGHAGSLSYSTAKGATLTWTRSLASELAPQGIRVNAVAPGLILGTRFHQTHTTNESADRTVEGIPLGRPGHPDDVARPVIFLASEFDGFITGATLDINGGVYCA
ncbi:SDR family NAD(P)-dependent oxidoreductase [Botrimarina hoheduenensis]|uniref:3-oxoacyl-[acyl-carrier-protein] reductase FabG n=1 Tax=Botrimarina hoheduenensis TaxID=2528000 RepID=A0A5C5VSG4_9BACT|nr:SDR family oxidoreductase [Botrimarina hoheduenensis]TWT40845.1 3-oxoacyl-[acyl-carrier-protein] reductase FabG [Botrimarina hoheduenensis]